MKLMTPAAFTLMLAVASLDVQAQSVNQVETRSFGGSMYEVTITNVTRGSFFTPILVASHRSSVELFTLGQTASPELAILAEGGDTVPLEEVLRANNRVIDVANSGGLLEPGQSVSVRVAARSASQISIAAMILPTNDGFIALNGVPAPRFGMRTYEALGYDAGSEPNDELCAAIPGPQCGGEGVSPDAGGEDFVHVHSGIHGIADLPPQDYDWRNPMATVTIKRVF